MLEPELPAIILGFDSISIRCHFTRMLSGLIVCRKVTCWSLNFQQPLLVSIQFQFAVT